MARTANVSRKTGAAIVAKDQGPEAVADRLAAMVVDVVKGAGSDVKLDTLRVTVDTATVDPSFWQLRAGVQTGAGDDAATLDES
jgi:hypothetical protein